MHVRWQIKVKSILTNFLKYLERSIPYWLYLFTFTLHSIFADIQLDLITNLETMLHLMLFMPCLVFGLDLFQLFFYYLVDLLDF